MDQLAKWAAQDPTHRRAGYVTEMLYLAARIREVGDDIIKNKARECINDFRDGKIRTMPDLNNKLRQLLE